MALDLETPLPVDPDRIRNAWIGRVSGCQLGKAVEVMSFTRGTAGLRAYLSEVDALPLRDYIPYVKGSGVFRRSCRDQMDRSAVDDDINYSVLALMLLEDHGRDLTTADVARSWLLRLPIGITFTAERAALLTLAERAENDFAFGGAAGFDLHACSDNAFNDWIGAQIRADVYGWVCPGAPGLAARLARQDAELSHRGDGVGGAAFIAALGAALPVASDPAAAVASAMTHIEEFPDTVAAVEFGASLIEMDDPLDDLQARYRDLSPVHTLNNLSLVVWGLLRHADDFSAAIGDTVAAGWDTDCNGATVGALWGLTGQEVPHRWAAPWNGRIDVGLAGVGELLLDDLVARTVSVANAIAGSTER